MSIKPIEEYDYVEYLEERVHLISDVAEKLFSTVNTMVNSLASSTNVPANLIIALSDCELTLVRHRDLVARWDKYCQDREDLR